MNRHLALLSLVFGFSSLPVSAILDTNENGLSDLWEAQYKVGEHLTANLDPAVDDDGDGWTNALEAIAGTDPFDPSPPYGLLSQECHYIPEHWADTDNDGDLEYFAASVGVSWLTVPGKQYTLLFSLELYDGPWYNFEQPFVGVGTIVKYTREMDQNIIKFWRVKVEDVDTDGDGLTSAEECMIGTNSAKCDTDVDGVSDWDELVTNATDPLQALDLDADGMADDLEKHLAKQFLASHPNPDDWVGFHADLVAGNLAPNHAYTADGNIASVVPTLVAMAAYPPLSDRAFIEPQYRENSLGAHTYATPPAGQNAASGTYYFSRLGEANGSTPLTSPDDFVSSYLTTGIAGLPWLPYAGPGDLVFQYLSYEWLLGESTAWFDTGQSVPGETIHSGAINQRRSRLAIGRLDHEPEAFFFLKVTTREPINDPVSSPVIIAAETVVLDLPADRLTGDWVELAAPMADGQYTVMKLVSVNVTLDVNGSGDALGTYLPGYEAGVAKLHTGDSFKNNSYSGPQQLTLVIPGIDPVIADAATFRILNPTSYYGYCGNALIATGTTPADDAKNREDDFSFAADGNDRETQATVANGAIRAPIFCKDYGAWCEVEITLRKGSAVLGPPFTITLPLDRDHDKLADIWQLGEILRWNQQFRLKQGDPNWVDPQDSTVWGRIFGVLDEEFADSDGDAGPMPAMTDKGDGLSAHDEYRGFFLDGGSNCSTPAHRRLSVARKELLVECSEMEGIASTTLRLPPEGSFTDQGNDPNAFAQAYTLTATMSHIAAFFAKEGPSTGSNPKYYPGAAIDTWWVKDKLNDMGYVVYDSGAMGSTHKYSGPYKDLQRPNDATRDRNGWLSIASDQNLAISDPEEFSILYGGNQQGNVGGQGVAVLGNYGNRNNQCTHFIKLAVQGRKGFKSTNGNFYAKTNEAAREQDDRQENRATHQGASIFINSLSEEPDLVNQAAFEGRLEWSIAHELAHLFVGNDDDHFDGVGNVLSTNLGGGLSSFVEEEITNTRLRQRASINRDANGNPQP